MAVNKKDDLLASFVELETAAQAFAAAHANFTTAADAVIKAADTDNRKVTLNSNVGPSRVNDFLVMRLRALGLGPMLVRGRVPGTLSETWVSELQTKVNSLV